MAILPKATYRLNVIPTEIPMTFRTELAQMNLKFIQNHKKPYIVKAILPDFGLYYKATGSKYISTGTKPDTQNNGTEQSPEINPHSHSQLTYNRGGKNIQWRKDNFFDKWCWENWTATCKRMT